MEQDAVLSALVASAVSHCAAVVQTNGTLILSLFLAGLVGGATHCAPMCGPFVLSQVGARLEGVPAHRMREWHRLTGAAVLPYQFGRLTTYSLLGAAAASLVGGLSDLAGLRWLSAGLLAFAALFFLSYALPQLRVRLASVGGGSWWSEAVARTAKPLFASPTGGRGYMLGLLLGFIPCGLLYGALAAAASSRDPLAGAFGMAAFALGTMPSLFAVGLAGHLAGLRWRAATAKAAPLLLVINAGVLGWMAVSLLV